MNIKDVDGFRETGFFVSEDLLAPAEIAELRAETAHIFRGGRGPVDGLQPTMPGETDLEVLKKYTAIHFPHKISPVIYRYLHHPKVVRILTDLIGPNVKCMQSMLFVKGPGKKGQSWHQDEYYIPTRDKSLLGAWMALDDAVVDNGCLWIIPGSHKLGYIMPRGVNVDTEFADVDTVEVSSFGGQAIPVEVPSGSVVFFNGYTLHSSLSNRTPDHFRTALVNHYMSAESMLPWDQDGKLLPTEDMRDIVLVSGKDPYAWKGTLDVNQPYLRPDVIQPLSTQRTNQ